MNVFWIEKHQENVSTSDGRLTYESEVAIWPILFRQHRDIFPSAKHSTDARKILT